MVMQVRALKTFNSKQHGLVRTGMVITVDDSYARKLITTKPPLAEVIAPSNKSLSGPDLQKAQLQQEAEVELGNGQGDDATVDSSQSSNDGKTSQEPEQASGATESSTEDPPEGGRGRRSSSQPRGRRSRKSK